MEYMIFVEHPTKALAFLGLIITFISLWVRRAPWLWGSLLAASCLFAFVGKLIDFRMVIALAILCISHLILTAKLCGGTRLIVALVAFVISVLLIGHYFPGFHNWKIMGPTKLSPGAYPYSFYLNFDKPLIGLFPLALSIPLLSRMHLRSVLVKTFVLTALGIVILMLVALSLHLVKIDPKFPAITPLWLIANLFLVSLPEEAFFRGFLQREIHDHFHTKWSGPLGIFLVSVAFALLHFLFLQSYSYLLLAFLASLIYGTIYHVTRAIESAIFAHFLFNCLYFFCFSYPLLQK